MKRVIIRPHAVYLARSGFMLHVDAIRGRRKQAVVMFRTLGGSVPITMKLRHFAPQMRGKIA
jgi:hypothetical protein